MDMSWEKFRKKFPHLAREMQEKAMRHPIKGVRWEGAEGYDELRNPDAVSFLRRCSTDEEAYEVIAYLEKTGQVSVEYGEKLRTQIRERGLKSFGEKKDRGYYFRKYYREKGNAAQF